MAKAVYYDEPQYEGQEPLGFRGADDEAFYGAADPAGDFWKESIANIPSDWTPLTSNIPAYEEWLTPEKQAYYEARDAARAGTLKISPTELQQMAAEAGVAYSQDNPPEADYANQYYDLPSYGGTDPFNWLPVALAAGFGGAAASGALGGVTAAEVGGAASALEGTSALAGAALEAPVGTALGTGAAAGTAAETAIADLVATGMSPEAAAAAVASGGSTLSSIAAPASTSLIPGVSDQVLSGVAQGTAGVIGAGLATDAYEDVSEDLLALGDPYRDLLEASYAPDFNLFDQPSYAESLDQLADITSRQYTASGGNPANNPGLQGDIYNSVLQTAYLPALESYQSGLAAAGGLGVQPASQAMMMVPPTQAAGMNAIGYGIGTALAPPNPYDALAKSMTNYYNTVGGVKV